MGRETRPREFNPQSKEDAILACLWHLAKAVQSLAYNDNKKYLAAQLGNVCRITEAFLDPPQANEAPTPPQENHDYYPHYTKNPQLVIEPSVPSNITPAMAEALLHEARERQLKAREQRIRRPSTNEPGRPENNLSDF